jgi:nucleoprotein TPR
MGPATSGLPAKVTEESDKRFTFTKTTAETRRISRKLVRPRLVKSEEPQGDIEMSEVEASNIVGKPAPPSDTENQGHLSLQTQPLVRKRIASSSTSELHEEAVIQGETSSDVTPPVLKKSKGSEPHQEIAGGQFSAPVEDLGTLPGTEESFGGGELPQGSNEEAMDAEKEEVDTTGDKAEAAKEQFDGMSQDELQSEKNNVLEENLDRPGGSEMVSDDGPKDQAEQENQQSIMESESDREEGELVPDVADPEGGGDISNTMGSPEIVEGQAEPVATPVASPARADDEALVGAAVELGEINSLEGVNDEKNDATEETAEGSDKSNDGNDQVAVEADQVTEALPVPVESTSASAAAEVDVPEQASPASKQASSTVTTEGGEVVRQVSPAGGTSTTINLSERARQNAAKRLGVVSSPVVRGRGRAVQRGRAGRGTRGGRMGRGQSPGEQG